MKTNKKQRRILFFVAVILVYAVYAWQQRSTAPPPHPAREETSAAFQEGESAVLELYRERRSGVMVEVDARVIELLADDTRPPRHQRFVVALSRGHTLLISHNIDLAPRAPITVGDRARIRGQYEWNERGGVVHWTHHDPRGRRRGGFIRHREQEYR